MNAFATRAMIVAIILLGPLVLHHLKVDGRADVTQDIKKRHSPAAHGDAADDVQGRSS